SSTGGTSRFLREQGIKVTDISDYTGFPEIMDGRVKTLHPHIHMGLLARPDQDEDCHALAQRGLEPFDLVVVNLYPFESSLIAGVSERELIEKIDVGGPSMLRAAAKNYQFVTVVTDPSDYRWIQEKKGKTTLDERKKLAAKVFAHLSVYDSMIARALGGTDSATSIGGYLVQKLRYGENPHQSASWLRLPGNTRGLHVAKVLQGKELSYNNLLDIDAAASLAVQFAEPAAVVVKHNNPCGVGINENSDRALELALKSDPVSVFGGIVACNREITAAQAQMLAGIFLECVVAPSFADEARTILSVKKSLRLLAWPEMSLNLDPEVRSINGGFLLQERDSVFANPESWKYIGENPSAEIVRDLVYAERIVASLKSNAIAIVASGQALGLGMGQVNRVEAVEHAVKRFQQHHRLEKSPVLASDAFFPFRDSVEVAARAGVKWILQPGGSLRDEEVIATAKELGVNMVLTGVRHFRH
ncbi:MAG: bifunctional phosphoribosylaminoimidazolecarboxamide formyltransferase/IMP cyclohydrolase, partial [Bdellovibrionaceae bacterium]|nr:bifunctional phosphoribosylaminoimidazolecarboxamide formyltransferase/IMP cyclohydrolase [Pseudobdellovibrionaceae bacterium]